MNDCDFPGGYPSYRITPYKVFISHSGEDKDITNNIFRVLEHNRSILPYVAERDSIGVPLMPKLRSELLDSDSILIVWTKNAKERACEIIAFETGMAWAEHLNIFLIKDKSADDPTWFYQQLTDYVKIDINEMISLKNEDLVNELDKLKFEYYCNPLCIYFPKKDNSKKNSKNEDCVADNGSINLRCPFDDILYFIFGNHTNRIIQDIRITMEFPPQISVIFDEGDRGLSIKREIFWMRAISSNIVRLAWPVLPSEEHWVPELRLVVHDIKEEIRDFIRVTIQGGEYAKRQITIPITLMPKLVTRNL